MNHEIAKTPANAELQLVANGSCGCWDVDLDESPETGEWLMELNGPQAYLVFQLRKAAVVSEAIQFLKTTLQTTATNATGWNEKNDSLSLGRFGNAAVSLVRDNEKAPRCFITIGRPPSRSLLHLNLNAADIESLVGALGQVEQDLSPTAPGEAASA